MVLIFISVAPEDGKPGITATDISLKYYGNRSGTRLEQALTGTMKPNRTLCSELLQLRLVRS
jgi:hypothetical protein